jgi:serine phosphatase RsbU (regulator of sigma subunit)
MDLSLVEAMATQCAQAIERIQIVELNREAASQIARMVESVQRSLLTSSPIPPELDVAARYIPAAQAVQVGGDWFDYFTTETGSTLLVVGDVAGHDGHATASMAQLRNLLRGMALAGGYGPAALLARLDSAIHSLGLHIVATVVIAELLADAGPAETMDPPGSLVLRWASAGHPPPLIRSVDDEVRVLAGRNDLLLGADPTAERAEHVTVLGAGDALILYTDGLIERRGKHLEEGLAELVGASGLGDGTSAEALCAEIVDTLVVGPPADDIVVLVAVRRPSVD